MPVAQTRGHAGKALLIAGVAVGLLLVLTFLVAQAANRGDVQIRLGDDRFDAGSAKAMAETIDEGDGLPILYSDLIGEGRNLFVQHVGDEPDEGWTSFGAYDPDDPDCEIDFTDDRDGIEDCEGREQPLDGDGLRAFPTTVEDGRVYVDINERSTTTTTR